MEGCSISGGCSGVVPKVTKRIGGGIEGIREALVGQNVLEHGGGVLGLRPDVVEDFLNEHQDPVTAMGKQGVKVAVKGEGAVVNVGEWGEVEATIEGLEIVQDGEEGWCEFFVLGRKGTLLIAGGARRRVVIGGGEVKVKVAVGGAKVGTARVGIAVGVGGGGGGVIYSKGVEVEVKAKAKAA